MVPGRRDERLPGGRESEYFAGCYARLSQDVITSAGRLAGQGMRWTIALVLTLLAAAPARAQADRAKTIEDLHKKSPPIVFFIAHGGADSCGTGCDSWIAAEGRIDDEAPARLRRALEQAGKRKLPIYFQSPGGGMREAMEIGRMLRSRGLTAGVGRTLPQGCWPAKTLDVCSKAMQEKPAETAVLVTSGASCLSACPFALIGASTRLIAPTALVGVHEALAYFKRTNGVSGRRLERALEQLESTWDKEFARYLAEMGIDKGLFAVVRQTPFEKMRYLTRAELIAFRIDPRNLLVQSGWNVDYLDAASLGTAAYVTVLLRPNAETAGASADQPKPTTVAISCSYRPGGGYLLTSLRPIANTAARATSDLLMSADFVRVPLTANSSFLDNSNGQLLEVRQARLTRLVLDLMAETRSLSISGDLRRQEASAQPVAAGGGASSPDAQATIPRLGLGDAVKTIEARCERK